MNSSITFSGGAGTVTGANFLLTTPDTKVLVDCGARERERACDSANTEPFPYDVRAIEALFVTHAHQDHIGRIPRLVREGFRGRIRSTKATRDIAAVMLEDALAVMTSEVERHGCDPLFEEKDVARALSLWDGHEYHEPIPCRGMEAVFLDAGHILGSAMVRFVRNGRHALFTGDLGNAPEPLLMPTESPVGAHFVVIESVYGDRVHEGREERREILRSAVEEARTRKGVLLIPSFSLERTQVLLYELNDMIESGEMKPIPLYLDSPLAIRITGLFRTHARLMNETARLHFERGDDPFSFPGLRVVKDTRESHAIHREPDPKIIIAGAGMSGGGRIRAHEKAYLGNKRATVLFAGYQAPGTLGRRLEEGEKRVLIDGAPIRVRARFTKLTGYSGHADRDALLSFIEKAAPSLKRVFVTMGEPKASLFLAQRARDFLGVDAIAPGLGETHEIDF